MTEKYRHIHRLQFLYLDKSTGYVFVNENKLVSEGRSFIGNNSKPRRLKILKLDDDTMKKIEKIVGKRNQTDSDSDDD